jgi:hypothetical protein
MDRVNPHLHCSLQLLELSKAPVMFPMYGARGPDSVQVWTIYYVQSNPKKGLGISSFYHSTQRTMGGLGSGAEIKFVFLLAKISSERKFEIRNLKTE